MISIFPPDQGIQIFNVNKVNLRHLSYQSQPKTFSLGILKYWLSPIRMVRPLIFQSSIDFNFDDNSVAY